MTTIKIKTIIMIHNTNNMVITTIKEINKIMTSTKITMDNMIMMGNIIIMKGTIIKKDKIILIKYMNNQMWIELN